MYDPYNSIAPLIQLKSSLRDYKKFHSEVNRTFHNVEAEYYDDIHKEMWQNLPAQFDLLVNDLLLKKPKILSGTLSLLDLGCGTGLATHLLLRTAVAGQIENITLLDTSPVMLSFALKRSQKWNKITHIHEGEIADIDKKFDIIIISSVLHHIPDLSAFLNSVTTKLNAGGILIAVHDPLQEAILSDTYNARCQEYRNIINRRRKNIINRIYQAIKRRAFPANNPGYIGQANLILLENNIIHTPLTEVEMWSITDIHVEGLPYASQAGISLNWMRQQLNSLNLINYHTYCFFGLMQQQLNKTYRAKENRLILSGDRNGRNFGSIWVKNDETTVKPELSLKKNIENTIYSS